MRALFILPILVLLAACGRQPFVVNQYASVDPYQNKLIYVGAPSGYTDAFRVLFTEHVACPLGYEPDAHIETRQIFGSELIANPTLAATLRQQIDSLYYGKERQQRLEELQYVYGKPDTRYLSQVTVKHRRCIPLR